MRMRRSWLNLAATVVCAVGTVVAVNTAHAAAPEAAPLPRLGVSDNGRFLVRADGSPFFWLADTAWILFNRLNREDTVSYLQTRADQGFTVVQAVAVPPVEGSTTPNQQDDLPFVDNDPTTPATTEGANPDNADEYDFWDHVDFTVAEASARGIYTAMLPVWGQEVLDGLVDEGNAEAYGRFLGQRYADDNVIWVLGGDKPADGYEDVWRTLAKGIAIGASGSEDYSQVLMTYHPQGAQTSSQWFHDDEWLDFNMEQNGHCPVDRGDPYNRIAEDYARTPAKPVLDGEPLYENHPICYDHPQYGYSDDYDIRTYAWWQVFAGAFGHTYGHHSVWQFYTPDRAPEIDARTYWYDAVAEPGGAQMGHLRELMESRPFLSRIPDQSVLTSDPGTGTDHVQATRDADGTYLMVYSASGAEFTVDLEKLSGETATGHWYDPRTGESSAIGSFPSTGAKSFTPPSSGRGNDWVLVVDGVA